MADTPVKAAGARSTHHLSSKLVGTGVEGVNGLLECRGLHSHELCAQWSFYSLVAESKPFWKAWSDFCEVRCGLWFPIVAICAVLTLTLQINFSLPITDQKYLVISLRILPEVLLAGIFLAYLSTLDHRVAFYLRPGLPHIQIKAFQMCFKYMWQLTVQPKRTASS